MSAHTFSIPDYSVLESDLDRFYIDQRAAVSGGCGGCEPVRVGVEEKQALENLLLQMIRCVQLMQLVISIASAASRVMPSNKLLLHSCNFSHPYYKAVFI